MATEKKNKFRDNPVVEPTVEVEEQTFPQHNVEDYEEKPAKKNRVKSKSPKQADEQPKTRTQKKKITFADRWQQVVTVYGDERTQKITGLVLVLVSAYLAIAFVSYFT